MITDKALIHIGVGLYWIFYAPNTYRIVSWRHSFNLVEGTVANTQNLQGGNTYVPEWEEI